MKYLKKIITIYFYCQACTLARRTAETFLKYSARSLQFYSLKGESSFRGPEQRVKGENVGFGKIPHFV